MALAEEVVRAAGGVIWRLCDAEPGTIEVVLVHRPAYDDWSLPKGKAEPGESDEDTAIREVAEETGLVVSLGRELPSTHYRDRYSRSKVVRYWLMTRVAGELGAAMEVDAVRWVPLEEARELLSYERDLPVLDALHDALPGQPRGPAGPGRSPRPEGGLSRSGP